jgi:hypothetical protein
LELTRYAENEDRHAVIVPTIVTNQQGVNAAIRGVANLLAPDVVRIRYEIGKDWSDDWAIFFRILLSDVAAKKRLNDVANQVERRLDELLDFQGMGVFPYYNYRSESEQAVLREKAWA